MKRPAALLVVVGAAVLGAVAASCYAIATGLALNAQSRAWEMGAIPLLIAAFVLVGVLAGIVAGLVCRQHPYRAATLASLVVFTVAVGVNEFREVLTPQMTRDERREFWANIEGLLFAGFPFGLPLALWGALMVDRDAGRLRRLRDASYDLAGFVGFLALVPVALHWLPWQIGVAVAAAAALIFRLWIGRRNRRMSDSVPQQ